MYQTDCTAESSCCVLFTPRLLSRNLSLSVLIPLSLCPATASKLVLTSSRSLTGNINTDIEIKCSVVQETSPSVRYAVTWQLQKRDESKTIVSSDRDAVVTFGAQLEPNSRQRIGIKRSAGPAFELLIRHAQISDGGSYICEVVEWLQDPQNHWYPLPPLSRTIVVTLTEPGMFNSIHAGTQVTLQPE